jgi:hypothetical protein
MRGALLVLVITASCGARTRPEPPQLEEIAAWAHDGGWRVSSATCLDTEQHAFGAIASACWFARQRTPEPGTRDVFPRVDIVVAAYPDEAAARARMARFHEIPDDLHGAEQLVYPLRAGFRIGARVVLVTTDALRFEDAAYRAAAALAVRAGGRDVTCWLRCPAS